jgi:hypothetical protein
MTDPYQIDHKQCALNALDAVSILTAILAVFGVSIPYLNTFIFLKVVLDILKIIRYLPHFSYQPHTAVRFTAATYIGCISIKTSINPDKPQLKISFRHEVKTLPFVKSLLKLSLVKNCKKDKWEVQYKLQQSWFSWDISQSSTNLTAFEYQKLTGTEGSISLTMTFYEPSLIPEDLEASLKTTSYGTLETMQALEDCRRVKSEYYPMNEQARLIGASI